MPISTATTHVVGASSLTATGNDLTVKAINKTDITTTADATGGGALGAAVAIVLVFETTEAFVESTGAITAASLTISANSDNKVTTTVKAQPDGADTNADASKSPDDRTKNPKTGQGNAKTSEGKVDRAAALGFNYLSAPTEAHLDSTGLTITTTGEVKVLSSSKNEAAVTADASAVSGRLVRVRDRRRGQRRRRGQPRLRRRDSDDRRDQADDPGDHPGHGQVHGLGDVRREGRLDRRRRRPGGQQPDPPRRGLHRGRRGAHPQGRRDRRPGEGRVDH